LRRLRDVSLAALPQLTVVDADVFRDLPRLRVLRLHDNRRLAYLDPRALGGPGAAPTSLRTRLATSTA